MLGKTIAVENRQRFESTMLNRNETDAERRLHEWNERVVWGTKPFDKARVIEAVQAVYRIHEFEAPTVLFCENPLDLVRRIQWADEQPAFEASAEFQAVSIPGYPRRVEKSLWDVRDLRIGMMDETHPADRWIDCINAHIRLNEGEHAERILRRAVWLGWRQWVLDWWLNEPSFDSAMDRIAHGWLDATFTLAEECCCVWPAEKVLFVCCKPKSLHVEHMQLHHDEKPAIEWPDGFAIYALHGVNIPEHLFRARHQMPIEEIVQEHNIAVRSALLNSINAERLVTELGGNLIHEDKFGQLYRTQIAGIREPIHIVRLQNSTPEPDGSFRIYHLRVPPSIGCAKEAVAWSFGLTEEEYSPAMET